MPPLSDPCNTANQAQLRSSGLPGEAPKPVNNIPVTCVPVPQCNKCKRESKVGMRYIQPEVPASFKPGQKYSPPAYPFESGTIYSYSYPGVTAELMKDCTPKHHPVQDNIRPCSLPFSQDTTFRLSYTGVAGEKAVSYKPLYRSMMGSGPMQCVTTHRHDYSPKMSEKVIIRKQCNNIHLSKAKMEDCTTMSLSYQPVEGEKATSYKPVSVYKQSNYKFEEDTINRLSYQPWDPMPKEEFPWVKREKYRQPEYAMENHTIYRASYLPVDCVERPTQFRPSPCLGLMSPNRPFESATIYRESYQDNGTLPPPERVIRKENIYLNTQPMSQDTTFRLSYTGVCGEKAVPYKPLLRTMMGAGPMQCITTNRHDYTPKPFVPVPNFKPKVTLTHNDYKMDDLTTFRASYLPNEVMPKTESYKPVSVYKKSNYVFESDTINRLSYQPWSPTPKETYPWTKRDKYQQPTRCMDGTSIYRGSYLAPGNYVPDDCSPNNYNMTQQEECTCPKETSATEDLC